MTDIEKAIKDIQGMDYFPPEDYFKDNKVADIVEDFIILFEALRQAHIDKLIAYRDSLTNQTQ